MDGQVLPVDAAVLVVVLERGVLFEALGGDVLAEEAALVLDGGVREVVDHPVHDFADVEVGLLAAGGLGDVDRAVDIDGHGDRIAEHRLAGDQRADEAVLTRMALRGRGEGGEQREEGEWSEGLHEFRAYGDIKGVHTSTREWAGRVLERGSLVRLNGGWISSGLKSAVQYTDQFPDMPRFNPAASARRTRPPASRPCGEGCGAASRIAKSARGSARGHRRRNRPGFRSGPSRPPRAAG